MDRITRNINKESSITTLYGRRKNGKLLYKAGVNTKISHGNFKEFDNRFFEENAKLIQDAKEEMDRIRSNRRKI